MRPGQQDNGARRLAKRIYLMITSLDGYAEAAEGDLCTGTDNQKVHTFINDVFRPIRGGPGARQRSGSRGPRSLRHHLRGRLIRELGANVGQPVEPAADRMPVGNTPRSSSPARGSVGGVYIQMTCRTLTLI